MILSLSSIIQRRFSSPEHAHVQPLQVGPRQESVDQHSRNVVEHEFREIDSRCIGEPSFVDTLEGEVSSRSNDGSAATQGRCVGGSNEVADGRFRWFEWSVN